MSDLRELYQEVILDHSRKPRNFRVLQHARCASGHNPLCDRDGEFCSASVIHDGPCTPHGGTR